MRIGVVFILDNNAPFVHATHRLTLLPGQHLGFQLAADYSLSAMPSFYYG